MASCCLLFENNIYLQRLVPVAPDSSSYRVWFLYMGERMLRPLDFARGDIKFISVFVKQK